LERTILLSELVLPSSSSALGVAVDTSNCGTISAPGKSGFL